MLRTLWLVALLLCRGEARGEDEVTTSLTGAFKIVQHNQDLSKQTIEFIKPSARSVTLDEGISWPALYYISPDEQWILRIQKSGSGDNISWLYQVDSQHRVWRLEEQIGVLGFAYLAQQPGLPRDLYHTGIEFGSWALEAGMLHFTIHGSDVRQSGQGIDRALSYDLRAQRIVAP